MRINQNESRRAIRYSLQYQLHLINNFRRIYFEDREPKYGIVDISSLLRISIVSPQRKLYMKNMNSRKLTFWLIVAIVLSLSIETIQAGVQSVVVPTFSVQRGFYQSNFTVVVSATSQDTILYTLDGSDPRTSKASFRKLSPTTIVVSPDSSTGGRGVAPGVILRACTLAPDKSTSEAVTHTYLFVGKVKSLSPVGKKPGPGWPDTTSVSAKQTIDYGMAADVLNDPRYKNSIDSALVSIPSISVSTDLKNLFASDSGIYMNAYQDGIGWERPVSVELLNPNGTEGFQVNAGIRIRGGASRSGVDRKHAFRLFFRSEYGFSKLEYPLFEKEGVEKFDKVDLRTGQNYSWAFPGHLGQYNTMISDVFCRDLQGKMGEPYTRSRFYHLYLNGVYWGLYQTQERPEARYAESYFGGSSDDYDVVKSGDGWPASIEVTDGNFDAYREVWNLCLSGFGTNDNYFKLQGLNPDGTRNSSLKVLVDVDNLIDFMLNIFYAGNFDASTTKFDNNKSPRNFYAIYNRNNSNNGFQFFIHDAEHTLRTTPGEWGDWYKSDPTVGVNENRVNIGAITTYLKMTVSDFTKFHPQWLHFKLSDNAEYRMRFADHVYKHFFNDGWMMPKKASELFLSRKNEIDGAIIAESARWGDVYASPSRTKDGDWLPAIHDILNNYFPARTDIVLGQIKAAGLYPVINPPLFRHTSDTLLTSIITIDPGYGVKIQKPASVNGNIRYTIDGNDPRAIGGTVSSYALNGGDSVAVTVHTTTILKARIQNGSNWSALHEIILSMTGGTSDLKVTEIHYHPLDRDTIDDGEYEFIELKNTGTNPMNLSQAKFVTGITYTFPTGTLLHPGKFILLASNRQEFNVRYGFYPFGEYAGQLDNSGELVTLCSVQGDTIFSIRYDDSAPWPVTPDGGGYSLVPKEINPTLNQNDPVTWRASRDIHGSPGRDDVPGTSVHPNAELVPQDFTLQQNYPNPFNPSTNIFYTLKSASMVRLTVFDLLGREVEVLVNSVQTAGKYQVTFSGSGCSSGLYFYRLESSGTTITKKMALLK
jgi:hypothetical protein